MRNAKLWSVLLAAVLLCACIAGVLFTGSSASTVTVPYAVDGTEYASVKAAIVAAKTRTWAANEVMEITLSIADTSANVTTPEAGESANLLFGQTTIFRADGSKLPITIKGSGSTASIAGPAKTVACANDYTFRDLTYTAGSKSYVLYAGSGNVIFERVTFSTSKGIFYADNFTQDAFAGWDELEEGEFVETSITFGEGVKYPYDSDANKYPISAVGYSPAGCTFGNAANYLKSDGSLDQAKVDAALAEAESLTFGAATNGLNCSDIRPINTKTTFTVDNQIGDELAAPRMYVRMGSSPVACSTAEYKRTYSCGLTADSHTAKSQTYVGDIKMVLDGATLKDTGVYFRGLNKSNLIGNFSVEIHDTPDDGFDTYSQIFQGGNTSCLIVGDYSFTMTGGTLGNGQVGTIDGYYGAGTATGSIVNRVSGGHIWQFGGIRLAPFGENTKVVVSDGTKEGKIEKYVTVHNIISGGTFGGEKGYNDNATAINGFCGATNSNSNSNILVPSVCNEISGGTFYNFSGGASTYTSRNKTEYAAVAGTVDEVINVVSGGTFIGDFYGTGKTLIYSGVKYYPTPVENVTNYILGGEFRKKIYGANNHAVDSVKNVITGGTVDYFYGAYYSKVANDVTNDLRAGSVNNFYGLAYSDVTGKVENEISGGEVNKYFYGVAFCNVEGIVTNKISGGTVDAGYGVYDQDGTTKLSAGHTFGGVINRISGTAQIKAYSCAFYANLPSVQNNVSGGVIFAYQGTNSGTATTVQNKVTGGEIGFDMATGDYAHFYGITGTTVTSVKNLLEGGNVYSFHGASNTASADSIYNKVSGATIKHGFVGAYNPKTVDKVTLEVTGGSFKSAMYAYFGSYSTANKNLEIENRISGGTFGGSALFGGYGGEIKSVATTISGSPQFTNSGATISFAPGNNNWPGRCREVNTTIEGGTFNGTVYGGSWSGQVTGDVRTTIKSGIFMSDFYGGNYACAKQRTGDKVIEGLAGKAIEGTIYNMIGVAGETETAPQFKKDFFGGNNGLTDAGYLINRSDCKVENTVHEGIFTGTYHGGNSAAAYRTKAEVEAPEIKLYVTNNIYGGQFNGSTNSYMGAGPSGSFVAGTGEVAAKVVGGEIKNNIYGGVFAGKFCGAFNDSCATMTLNITNHFYGGELQGTENNHMGCEKGTEMIGVIRNTFEDGFTTDGAYVYGAGNGIVRAPEGELYAVINVIRGGEFDGFWGAGGKADLEVYGSVKTTVYGGVFNGYKSGHMNNSIAGGVRNGKIVEGNVELMIEGGIFNGYVVGGTVYGTYHKDHNYPGDITVTIKGGTFKENIYAISKTAGEFTCAGKAVINVEQTAGKALAFAGTVSVDHFTSNEEPVEIGKKANLTVANLNGTLNVKQTQGWIARDYVILPAGASFNVLESADCFGKYEVEGSVVYGLGITPAGATIMLDERLGARILFNKEQVDVLGNDFEIEVMLGETALTKAGYKNLVEYRGYYSVIVNGIGLLDYATDITFTGQASLTISMEDLVNMGQKAWSGEWLDLCDALENLHNVYNLNQTGVYKPASVADKMSARRGDAGAYIHSVTASLLMSDAAGVRLDMILRSNPVNLNVQVNGVSVEDCATVEEVLVNNVTMYRVQIDLFFKAAAMEDTFKVVVSSEYGTYMTYGDTVANLAYRLATKEGNEYADNAEALLWYIQKASAVSAS